MYCLKSLSQSNFTSGSLRGVKSGRCCGKTTIAGACLFCHFGIPPCLLHITSLHQTGDKGQMFLYSYCTIGLCLGLQHMLLLVEQVTSLPRGRFSWLRCRGFPSSAVCPSTKMAEKAPDAATSPLASSYSSFRKIPRRSSSKHSNL